MQAKIAILPKCPALWVCRWGETEGCRGKKVPCSAMGQGTLNILCEAVISLLLIVFLFRFLKCAPLHVTNMRSVRISASGGDDDRRRAFPPPRRWCGAVLPPWCGVYHLVYHMVACAMTACHHLRGGILGCRLCPPACRRHPGRRNTGLRTAATPRGVAKMSASGHHLHIVHITASRYRVPPPSQLRLAP